MDDNNFWRRAEMDGNRSERRMNEPVERRKVQELLGHVDTCTNGKAINIGATAFTTTLNILSKTIFSVDFGQYDTVSSQEFKEAVMALLELGGKPNLADFFPILQPFDPQGFVRQGNVYGKKLLTIIDRIIDQRLQSRLNSSTCDDVSLTNKDVLDTLLDLIDKKRIFI
ncbi:hypothetical protein LXL04_026813 [Taraxacum kok-saghyz]